MTNIMLLIKTVYTFMLFFMKNYSVENVMQMQNLV